MIEKASHNIFSSAALRGIARCVFAAFLLLTAALDAFAQAASAVHESREYTEEHPLIYEDAWDLWPYVFLDDNGQPSGFNVELISLLCQELGIPYEIRLKPTHQALEDLYNGRSDLMMGMMADFHDGFTRYYGKTILHLFTHSVVYPSDAVQRVRKLSDLSTQQVIVHNGSFSHHMMESHGWGLNAQPFEDMGLAIQMVSAEEAGQVLWNTMSLKWLIHKYHATNLTCSAVDMPSGEYRFMSNDSILLNMLDDAYGHLKATERLQPLEMKWFYPERADDQTSPAWLWYVIYALCIVAVLLTMASFMYHLRERRATAHGRRRINRLALVLKTCQVNIWTYDVVKKSIRWYGDDARTVNIMSPSTFFRRYWPAELDQLQAAITRLMNKESEEETLQMHNIDVASTETENRIFKVMLSVLMSDEGKPTVIICTEHDNTEEINNLQKTDSLMRRYQVVFSTAMVDMIYCDSEGYVMNMNQRAQNTFQRSTEQAIRERLNIKSIYPADDILSYIFFTHVMTPEGAPIPEGQIPNKDSRFYEMQILPVFDNEQKPLGVYATGREVTEMARTYIAANNGLKQLRQAMDEVDEYVSNINYVLQVGGMRIMTYSPDTHVLTIFHQMYETQYVLTQQRCLSLTSEESTSQVMRILRAMDNRTKVSVYGDIKTRLRMNGDSQVWLQVLMYPMLDDQGNVTTYEGMCRDVSEMKHTELMLQQETEKAQEVEQLKIKFLHNMCYAIRTPLDAVVESAEMFEKNHSPANEAIYIDTIKKNSAYLLKLVNDILFLSRLDAHMVETSKRECDFAKAIEAICNNSWIEGRRDEVVYEVENLYEQLVLDIDLTNVGRIIEYLLHNSLLYTMKGKVRVRYEYMGNQLVVGVDDTGDGIAPDLLEHAFERFNAQTGGINNTGLGLPICKELASMMGGQISISSEVGRGTSVWVSIPCEAKAIVRK